MRSRAWCETQVLLLRVEAVITYTYAQDADTTMLVRPPHDKLHPAYLEARIDFANGEYEKYQNTFAGVQHVLRPSSCAGGAA
ncbi:MAG: hypothetical protein ACLTSG_14585 [Lachnospiraceae bacterium]